MKGLSLLSFLFASLIVAGASAATVEVKMLNNGKEGIMVFEPAFVKVNKGDTVKFIPTDAGHDVESLTVPKGAKPWKGALNKAVSVKMTTEGVYLYECPAHAMMAMVGVIQVGNPTNLAEVQTAAKDHAKKFAMNKDRFDKYLAQVKK